MGGHVIPGCSVMTHRIPIKLQVPGKSSLTFNPISSSLHPGSHEILEPTYTREEIKQKKLFGNGKTQPNCTYNNQVTEMSTVVDQHNKTIITVQETDM